MWTAPVLVWRGALAIPAIAVCGGYAIGGRRTWLRILASLAPLATIPMWALTAVSVGGPALGLGTPRGLWVAVYLWSLLAVLSLGSAIPFGIRAVDPAPATSGRRDREPA